MILHLIQITGLLALYFAFYYITGSLALHVFPVKKEEADLFRRLILGFFVYQFLFTVAALPMKLLLLPLSWLSALWSVCLAVLVILFLIFERNAFLLRVRGLSFDKSTVFPAAILLAAMLVQTVLFNLNDETYALWDLSYYVGDTATSLYTNTISQYNPYTGMQLDYLNREYLLETYQNHSAVMCQLFHVHPLIEVRTVMASVVVILYQMIAYETGLTLLKGDKIKSAVMVWFLFLLNLFSFNLFTAGEFLMIRPFEGKTILAVLIIPSLLWLFLQTASEYENNAYWQHALLVILGSFGLNMSSVYMIPFEISALYLPLALRRKKLSVLIRFLGLLLPCVLIALLYLITRHNVIFYTGK